MKKSSGVIVVEVGQRSKRQLRRLDAGEGKLIDRVYDAIRNSRPDLAASSAEIRPLIILIRKTTNRRRTRSLISIGGLNQRCFAS